MQRILTVWASQRLPAQVPFGYSLQQVASRRRALGWPGARPARSCLPRYVGSLVMDERTTLRGTWKYRSVRGRTLVFRRPQGRLPGTPCRRAGPSGAIHKRCPVSAGRPVAEVLRMVNPPRSGCRNLWGFSRMSCFPICNGRMDAWSSLAYLSRSTIPAQRWCRGNLPSSARASWRHLRSLPARQKTRWS